MLTRSPGLLYRAGVAGVRFALVICGIRRIVEGVENIPSGTCIFVANHASNVDPPVVVCSIPRRVALLGKKEVFRIPIVGRALRLADMVPVDRADPDAAKESVEEALAHLNRGVSCLVFPEGTRSPDGRLRPFKKGSFLMAVRAQVPIVPVSVTRAHKVMRKGKFAIRPGIVGVKFHPPVTVAGYSFEHRDALVARVYSTVADGLPVDQQPLQASE
jgi:1-acyl-sn-glycerol-3-phosphate acyltransferase